MTFLVLKTVRSRSLSSKSYYMETSAAAAAAAWCEDLARIFFVSVFICFPFFPTCRVASGTGLGVVTSGMTYRPPRGREARKAEGNIGATRPSPASRGAWPRCRLASREAACTRARPHAHFGGVRAHPALLGRKCRCAARAEPQSGSADATPPRPLQGCLQCLPRPGRRQRPGRGDAAPMKPFAVPSASAKHGGVRTR